MKKTNVILFLVFILSGFAYYFFTGNITGNAISGTRGVFITRVIDGDTIVDSDGVHYRLLGINTTEKKTYLSNESLKFTQLLTNKTVNV